tara:strand:- start:3550 stop:5172 length:1623 start_codon:yes stop_codon:yes gene_type:complete
MISKKSFAFFSKKNSNHFLSFLCFILFILAYYHFTSPMLFLDVRNPREASLIWSDEGFHLKSIERMQLNKSGELLHHAYTAFYTNLSYGISWVINGLGDNISTREFITGSRWTAYLSIQSILLLIFWRLTKIFGSWQWAFLGMSFVGMQRGTFFYSVVMHPEATMLLGIVFAIFFATEYLIKPRFLFLFLTAIGSALAVSSKLQALLLLPWFAIIGILGLWIGRIKNIFLIFVWTLGYLLTFICGLIFFTPYQIFNFPRLLNGVIAEKNLGAAGGWDTNNELTILDWINFTISNELLGYSYTFLFLLTIFIFIKQFFKNIQKLRYWLCNPINALFFTNLIWFVIGAGFIFLTVDSLISRYLIHVAPSLMLITFIGVFWICINPKKIPQKFWLFILILFVASGMQQQIKHASFDFKVRKRVANKLVHIRKISDELKTIVPNDSHILNPHGHHIDSKWFVNSYHYQPTMQIFKKSNIEYLLMPDDYPGSLKREGISIENSKKSKEYREKMFFWNSLIENGINGQFQILKKFPEAKITLFIKN